VEESLALLRLTYGIGTPECVPSTQQEIRQRVWIPGEDTVLTLMADVMRLNRRLIRLDQGYNDKMLKTIVFPNLPIGVRTIAASTLHGDGTFTAWMMDLHRTIAMGNFMGTSGGATAPTSATTPPIGAALKPTQHDPGVTALYARGQRHGGHGGQGG
jgi:hypothetical protein